jgi:hypothetical protein
MANLKIVHIVMGKLYRNVTAELYRYGATLYVKIVDGDLYQKENGYLKRDFTQLLINYVKPV